MVASGHSTDGQDHHARGRRSRTAGPRHRRGRRSRGVARRVLAAVASLSMIVTGLVLSDPPPAEAGLYNIFPADGDGFPKGNFSSDEMLFVTMTSDIKGGFVCIVAAEITDPSTADCLFNVMMGEAHEYVGLGTLLGFPLKAAPLKPGKWRLMTVPELTVDEQFPVSNPILDKFMTITVPAKGTELSEVFTVRQCTSCDYTLADQQLERWKTMAAGLGPTPKEEMVKDALGVAIKTYKIAAGMYAGLSGGLSGVLLGGLGAGGYTALSLNIGPTSTNDLAKQIYTDLTNRVNNMWAGIAADPPDFNYDEAVVPVFPDFDETDVPLLNEYYRALSDAAGYGDASRIANERYQGAVIDGDHEAAYLQAQATVEYTQNLAGSLRMLQLLEPQVANYDLTSIGLPFTAGENALGAQPYFYGDLVSDESDASDVTDFWDQALLDLADLAANGLTPEQRDDLKACDAADIGHPGECPIGDDIIDAALSALADPDFLPALQAIDPHETIGERLLTQQGLYDDAIEQLDEFATWMAHNADDEYEASGVGTPNRAPVSAFTQSRTEGAAPLQVVFTSQATDPDGDDLTLRWDIAGARFVDDAETVTHNFTKPGTYWISLVATDPGGLWHQAISKVEVYPGDGGGTDPGENHAPVADFEPRTVEKDGAFTQTFAAISTDEDGDSLTHTWFFGDGTAYTDDVVTKHFEEGTETSILLIASDGLESSEASGWAVANWADGSSPGTNTAPEASFTMTPDVGESPLEILFESTSTDADGDTLTTHWDFGDGQAETNKRVVAHTYTRPGTYPVKLIVSDGKTSVTATRDVVVLEPVQPLAAAFTTAVAHDAASVLNGARVLDTAVPHQTNDLVENMLAPGTSKWRLTSAMGFEQTVLIELAGGGEDLIERIEIDTPDNSVGLAEFSLAISGTNNPFGAYTTLLDHQSIAGPTGYDVTPTKGKYLKFTTHASRGTSALDVTGLRALTGTKEGGLVSMAGAYGAQALFATTEYSSQYTAENALDDSTKYWSSLSGETTDQILRFQLGGEGPQPLEQVALGGRNTTSDAKDFEVWTSETGDEGSFTHALTATLAQSPDLQSFDLPSTPTAGFVELRLKNNHGGTYLYLREFRALTAAGENLASPTAFGGEIVAVTSNPNLATNLLQPDSAGGVWNAQTTGGQAITVALQGDDAHLVDRVMVRTSSSSRPKSMQIQVSTDGTTFTTVSSRSVANLAGDHWFTFTPTEAKFVRLLAPDRYQTSLTFQRVRVYAADRGGAVDVPFVDTSTGNPVDWHWDFDDGTTSTEQYPVHTFPGPGTYDVTLTVTDGDGETKQITIPYTVPGVPQVWFTGQGLAEDGDGDIVADEDLRVFMEGISWGFPKAAHWEWELTDFRSVSALATANPVGYTPDQGRHLVRVRGITPDGIATPWVERHLKSLNIDPTFAIGPDRTGRALDPINLAATALADSTYDGPNLTCTFDWGDGTAPEVVTDCPRIYEFNQVTHEFPAAGDYTVTVTVDDGGNLGSDGVAYGEPGAVTQSITVTATLRGSFLQVVDATRSGDDLDATVRLLDAHRGFPISGQQVTITAGGVSQTLTTDAEGYVNTVLAGAGSETVLSASSPETDLHEAASISRAVRAPQADIVFAVDESGSMGPYQEAVRENLRTIVQGLGSELDYHLGVVGYAAGAATHGTGTRAHLHAPLTGNVSEAFQGVTDFITDYGSANSYDAIVTSLGYDLPDNNAANDIADNGTMSFRSTAATCVVVITDANISEAGSSSSRSGYPHAEAALSQRGATLFSIIPDHEATIDAIGAAPGLAEATGGDWWLIKDFVEDPTEVLEALVSQCVTKAKTPDLAVAITAPTNPVDAGTDAVLTVTASNEAGIDVPGTSVNVTLPAGLALVEAPGGAYDATTRTVTWSGLTVDVGTSQDFTVTVRMLAGAQDPGDYPFEVTAEITHDGSLGDESDLTNNTANATVTFTVAEVTPPDVDLSVTISGTSLPLDPDADTVLTVTASNDSAVTADGVALTVVLPAGVDYVSAADGGTYDGATRTVTWPLFTLDAGESADRPLTVRIPAGDHDPGEHTFDVPAEVGYDEEFGEDVDPANNTATTTLTLLIPTPMPDVDLAVDITGTSSAVDPDEEIVLTVEATNGSDVAVAGVEVTVALPAGVAFVEAAGGGTYDATSATITWPEFGLGVGDMTDRTFTVKIPAGTHAPGEHPFEVTAEIGYDGEFGEDGDPANNTVTTTLTLLIPAPVPEVDLSVGITGPTDPVAADTDAVLTVRAINDSDVAVDGVVLTATMPDVLEFVSAADGGVHDAATRTVTWPGFALGVEASAERLLTVKMPAGDLAHGDYSFDLTAEIGYDGSLGDESDLTNNTASTTVTFTVAEVTVPDADLAVGITGTSLPLDPGADVVLTVTASNGSAVDVDGVALTATLPVGVEYVSVADGGVYDAATRIVSWPGFALAAGADADRTLTVQIPTGDHDPGEHTFDVSAAVSYDEAFGGDVDPTNDTALVTLTLLVPTPGVTGDITVVVGTIADPAGIEPGVLFDYPLEITYTGSDTTAHASLLQQVPERLEITAIDVPNGWVTANGGALSGPHPDGVTDGQWLHLSATSLAPDTVATVMITAKVLPLPLPPVVEDTGVLDVNLPPLAMIGSAPIEIEACVDAATNDDEGNDCTAVSLPTREITANVTTRLSDGITYLIVSVATTDALANDPVTLTWTPDAAGLAAGLAPVVLEDLAPGENHVITWPGGEFTPDGAVVQWPGWRMVTEADVDAEERVLDPSTGEPMTQSELDDWFRGDRIYDSGRAEAPWRLPSTVEFAANPAVRFEVNYREIVPMVENIDPVPEPAPEDPAPDDTAPDDTGPETPGTVTLPGGQILPVTGASTPVAGLLLITVLLGLAGAVLVCCARYRRRTAGVSG